MAKSEPSWSSQRMTGEKLVGLRYRHPVRHRRPQVPKAAACDPARASGPSSPPTTSPSRTARAWSTPRRATAPRTIRPASSTTCRSTAPYRGNGTYDTTVPTWLQGLDIWKANDLVVKHLRDSGHLFHDQKFMHSYPHDWRSKTPVIFRCTEQWFVGVDEPFTVKRDYEEPEAGWRSHRSRKKAARSRSSPSGAETACAACSSPAPTGASRGSARGASRSPRSSLNRGEVDAAS